MGSAVYGWSRGAVPWLSDSSRAETVAIRVETLYSICEQRESSLFTGLWRACLWDGLWHLNVEDLGVA